MRFSLWNWFDILILILILSIWGLWKLFNFLILSVLRHVHIWTSSILSSHEKSCITSLTLILLVSLNSGPFILGDFLRLSYLSKLFLLNRLILLLLINICSHRGFRPVLYRLYIVLILFEEDSINAISFALALFLTFRWENWIAAEAVIQRLAEVLLLTMMMLMLKAR